METSPERPRFWIEPRFLTARSRPWSRVGSALMDCRPTRDRSEDKRRVSRKSECLGRPPNRLAHDFHRINAFHLSDLSNLHSSISILRNILEDLIRSSVAILVQLVRRFRLCQTWLFVLVFIFVSFVNAIDKKLLILGRLGYEEIASD